MVKNLKKKKGFTLIELIIVIAILGILAAIAVPKFGNVQNDAKIKSDQSNGKLIADATAMAITKGNIALSAGNYVGSTSSEDYTSTAISLADATEVTSELSSVPKPKQASSATNFYVKISTNGEITVFRNAGTGDAGADPVYPQ